MELKVWVDGVVRVVCGLSLDTSCQDVVIALAQAIGEPLTFYFHKSKSLTAFTLPRGEQPVQRHWGAAGTGLIDESPLWSMSIKIWKTSPKHQHRQIQYLFVHHLVLPHLEASLDALTSIIKLFASKQISYWAIHMTHASSGTNTPAVWSLFTCYSYSTHHLLCTKRITTRIHKHTY